MAWKEGSGVSAICTKTSRNALKHSVKGWGRNSSPGDLNAGKWVTWPCCCPVFTVTRHKRYQDFPGTVCRHVAVSQCFHVNCTVFLFPPISSSLVLIPCAHLIEVREKKKRFEACPICSDIKRCLAPWKVVEASRVPDWHFNNVSVETARSTLLHCATPGSYRDLVSVATCRRGDRPWALVQDS